MEAGFQETLFPFSTDAPPIICSFFRKSIPRPPSFPPNLFHSHKKASSFLFVLPLVFAKYTIPPCIFRVFRHFSSFVHFFLSIFSLFIWVVDLFPHRTRHFIFFAQRKDGRRRASSIFQQERCFFRVSGGLEDVQVIQGQVRGVGVHQLVDELQALLRVELVAIAGAVVAGVAVAGQGAAAHAGG